MESLSVSAISQWYMIGMINTKTECPLVKIKQCPYKEECSPITYFLVVYVKPSGDLRLFTTIHRNTDIWKQTMKKKLPLS